MSKARARFSILSKLLSFPTIHGKDWQCDLSGFIPQVGDLISLSSAPDSKWYVSWVHEVRYEARVGYQYLLESIEDGGRVWWHNVGTSIYNREKVQANPQWKWSDDQFLISDRWYRICRKVNAYVVRPLQPVFHDDGSVTFDICTRHGFEDFSNPVTFQNYKKLTMRQMEKYIRDTVKTYNDRPRKVAA